MNHAPEVLVIGAGSAGKRHGQNLQALGCSIAYFDPRGDRLEAVAAAGEVLAVYSDLSAALREREWQGVVVASPPVYHVGQILDVLASQRCPVLTEKPLSVDAPSARRLVAHSARILLAYTYRWWPPIAELRRRLQAGQIGTVRNVRFVMSAHLADWHPWERYQDFFMAQARLGGGALLDESHFVDLMIWFLGRPHGVYAHVDTLSDLQIDTDDNVDILARYGDRLRVNLHLDLIGRPHERSITAVGESGTLHYSYEDNALLLGREGARVWERTDYSCERNDMFVGAAREFLGLVEGRPAERTCAVEDGIAALEVVDACRQSASSGRFVTLP
jgi:predicted dehydrogenase